MRLNFAERRLRVANNVRVRRATRVMSNATSLSEIFSATEELLELGKFVYANMELGHRNDVKRNGHGLSDEKKALMIRGTETNNGLIRWTWECGNIEANEIIGSGRFWTLRLPLSTQNAEWGYLNLYREFGGEALLLDINYLCDLFQRETAKAVERVLGAAGQGENTSQLVAVDVIGEAKGNELRVEGNRPVIHRWVAVSPE
jgi:hypothetical protein